MPKQPETDYLTRQAPRSGPIPVHVKADVLTLRIMPSPSLKTALVQLSGAGADKVREYWEKDGWHLDFPAVPDSITVRSAGGRINVRAGNVQSGVVIDGGDVYISGRRVRMEDDDSAGQRNQSVHIRGGRGIVISHGGMQVNSFSGGSFSSVSVGNGVVVTGGDAEDVPQAVLHVPADSQVYAAVENGEITVDGSTGAGLAMLAYQGHNGNISAQCPLGHLASQSHNGNINAEGPTGVVQVSTHNGHTTIAQALGQTTVQSHNGGIEIHAMDSVMIQAVTHNGSVNVTREPGTEPMVQASSYNGSVRKP
jgi:hypothetical protein